MALTDTSCRAAKRGPKMYKLSNSQGLQLWVQPNGARLWRLAYRYGGKQKVISLGAYPVISLAAARAARDNAKRLLVTGLDPSKAKKDARASRLLAETTFRGIADEYIAKLQREGRAETTISKIEWLLSFAYPLIGSRGITDIRPSRRVGGFADGGTARAT